MVSRNERGVCGRHRVNPDPPELGDGCIADAQDQLVRLSVQVESMQALLVRLLQEVIKAEARVDATDPSTLLEVNEKLVLAALSSQVKAETAAIALEAAEKAAALDALTRLPNRTILLDRCAQAIASSKRRGSRSALLFLDLDNFKALNDTHGHPFGDKVLQLIAERMLAAVREVDTVSRLGGDEFLILLAELSQVADARRVADKLLASIAEPAQIDDQVVNLTASLGIALYPDDGEDVTTLLAKADAAMYEAKRQWSSGMGLPEKGSSSEMQAPASSWNNSAAVIQQRNEDLREANEKLILAALSAQELREAADLAHRRQTAVIAAVAEELSNTQAPIRIATAMLGRVSSDEPVLPRVQGILEEQLTDMSHLIGNLVGTSELDPRGLDPHHDWVDLSGVVDAATAREMPMMDAREQHFSIERPADGLGVRGDAVMLEIVVRNLLHNASKHTYNGGRIVLSIAKSDDVLTLTVSDNGIGITPSMLPYIYVPFVQDTQALGFNGVGLGIGLTVARTLVRAHGGTLTAHSAGLKQGSRFVVTLPTAAREPGVAGAILKPLVSRLGE